MHTPDLFDGRTFGTIDEGFAFAANAGFDALRDRGVAAADEWGSDLVYAGFSFGVVVAQQLAQTRPGARGVGAERGAVPLPGDQHLFADASLDAYGPAASALLRERVRVFLASL